ncbi:biotin carboxyl carrier protein [Mesonia hippocampi]|uniref:Biotin carboxyl carrier protein n=1 Tax=Mesonia hippocampi TaxID=1628250 RepID=A0A840EVU2_9FLAO|nr:acetyl-CoA carboxylase biotin carboxyl carrier protein subunit [Mesonia hippocampi]MBB4119646.1 biotin carboxyl carrier protein [Mesonia hippocampi]
MNKNYRVKVNHTIALEIPKNEVEAFDTLQSSKKHYHSIDKYKSVSAKIEQSNFEERTYTVRVNANSYEIKIGNPLDALIEKMGLSLNQNQVVNSIKAPMPGLILEINVKEGDEVKEGDYLLVLEAMKMENAITAPRDAVIKAITIKQGDAVDKNQLLIEME